MTDQINSVAPIAGKQLNLCNKCAARMRETCKLTWLSRPASRKVTCGLCGERRFGSTYRLDEKEISVAPIIVKRSGELISAPELTTQQQEDLSMALFQAYCRLHPEVLREAVADYHAELRRKGVRI